MQTARLRRSRLEEVLLLGDALANFLLGVLLLLYPEPFIAAIGVPSTNVLFYPTLLGALLFGIGVALVVEYYRDALGVGGLGLGGGLAINVVAGLVLVGWLVSGELSLSGFGSTFLWLLVGGLALLSVLEVYAIREG